MVKFINRCKMQVASGGAGTITFGANAVAGFESLADQSVGAGDELRYTLEQNNEYEVGTGVIGLSGGTYTMTRTPLRSSNSDNSAISAGASAVCFFTMLADDVAQYLADMANVSDTSPSAGQALTWDAVAGTWKPASPSGGITNVSTYANLPGSPSVTDLAFVTDQKALYIYDGTEWDRVSTGSQVSPRFTTTPPVDHSLSSSGQTSAITTVAVDDAGFPITYDWDGFSGSTTYNSSSLPNQITNVSESNGVFTLTPSSNTSHAGNFTFRTKASDGVLTATSNTNVVLGFGLVNCYGFRMSQTYPTSGLFILYYLLLDSGGTNMWDDSSFVSDCTFNSVTYDHLVATYTNSDTTYAPGFVKAQQTELFGTTMANLNSYKMALVAADRSEVLDVTWTTPKSIGAVILSGVHATTGATYWQNGDIRPYIGGNATSDLVAAGTYTSSSSPALTDSTASGYTGTNNKFIDFTA
jgi:hypothetical protein